MNLNQKSDYSTKNFDWHKLKKPSALPRDEVIRAIERKGNCRLPMTFEPIHVFFRNESLYGFFEKWPSDIIFANIGLEPRRFNEVAKEDKEVFRSKSEEGLDVLIAKQNELRQGFFRDLPAGELPNPTDYALNYRDKKDELGSEVLRALNAEINDIYFPELTEPRPTAEEIRYSYAYFKMAENILGIL